MKAGAGSRVEGPDFRSSDVVSWVEIAGSRAQGREFRVQFSSCRVSIFGFRFSGSGSKVQGAPLERGGKGLSVARMTRTWFRVSGFRIRISGFGFEA